MRSLCLDIATDISLILDEGVSQTVYFTVFTGTVNNKKMSLLNYIIRQIAKFGTGNVRTLMPIKM